MTLRRTIALLLLPLFVFFIAACTDAPGTFGTWFGASDKPLLDITPQSRPSARAARIRYAPCKLELRFAVTSTSWALLSYSCFMPRYEGTASAAVRKTSGHTR